MSYPSGREHYHEPLPLRSGTKPYRTLLFSQRPRNNRPEPFDLGSDSSFGEFFSPVSSISTQGPTIAEIQAEFGALIGNTDNGEGWGEQFRQQRARLHPVPKIERPSVNILEPPSRRSRAPMSSSLGILPFESNPSSEYSSSPTSEYHTPARVRKVFPRSLGIELARQFEAPPYGSSSSSSEPSSVTSSESHSPGLYMRPSERIHLLPPTPRSPRVEVTNPVDKLQPIARHPYRHGSYLNDRYDYSTVEEHRRCEEDTGETWGDVWLDFLYLSVLFVSFISVIFVYAWVVLSFLRAWCRT
ncbi:uncharacterized protein BKA55DRAFT_685365 [Fusarium redolens]|uniref:Uncharacterized protein n=1 Tax=Fusarium redolens TaxID=48865 RepID=A0A9P9KJ39_FUSRE|nr:uncharacterized protein BKA55DRAFT_685365 [Fusarium redolens]KAH7264882.1 hypothetical protein BKA55DRAFT_685365 [Fusarium redolens]